MTDVKYRVYFYRKGEDKPYISCIIWSKFGTSGAESYARDSFHLSDNIEVKAEIA